MYCIAFYDINEKRVNKMLKLMRQYLNWIQNSVFEGNLTEFYLNEMIERAKLIMNEDEDSLIVFTMQTDKYIKKLYFGVPKDDLTSNII